MSLAIKILKKEIKARENWLDSYKLESTKKRERFKNEIKELEKAIQSLKE